MSKKSVRCCTPNHMRRSRCNTRHFENVAFFPFFLFLFFFSTKSDLFKSLISSFLPLSLFDPSHTRVPPSVHSVLLILQFSIHPSFFLPSSFLLPSYSHYATDRHDADAGARLLGRVVTRPCQVVTDHSTYASVGRR